SCAIDCDRSLRVTWFKILVETSAPARPGSNHNCWTPTRTATRETGCTLQDAVRIHEVAVTSTSKSKCNSTIHKADISKNGAKIEHLTVRKPNLHYTGTHYSAHSG